MADSIGDIQAEAARILALPPEQYAEIMLTMMYFKVLHPKGIDNLTVILDGSVFSVGKSDPVERLERASKQIAKELSARCSAEKSQ